MYRVLIADDEPIERMVVSKKIQQFFPDRLEVVQAENGEDAVRLFAQQQIAIALLDISMPGMDGLTAAEKIREMDSACSIVFLTAFDEFDYAKKAFSVRALDYLLKPSSDEELAAVLEEALRLAEQRQNAAKTRDKKPAALPVAAEADEKTHDDARLRAVTDAIRSYIQANYCSDLSLQDVAQEMGYSEAYFCKIFKQCFDRNFTAYLTEFRIEEAKKMLTDVSVNIKDISERTGFRDANYFARVFKRVTGETPSEYRVRALEKSGQHE